MHEIIILGLLHDGEQHGYQLKQIADDLMQGFFSVSYGTLYPKFKKFEELSFIKSKSYFSDGGQEKIAYLITKIGKEEFNKIMSYFPKESFQNAWIRFKIKALFFHHVNKDIRQKTIEHTRHLILNEIQKVQTAVINYNDNIFRQSVLKKSLEEMEKNLSWLDSINPNN